jgi:hypothetical protein
VNGVPLCPDCDKHVIGNEGKSLAEVTEAMMLTREEYLDALADQSKAVRFFGLVDPGNPAATEAIRKVRARHDAASLAYAKALRDYREFKRA